MSNRYPHDGQLDAVLESNRRMDADRARHEYLLAQATEWLYAVRVGIPITTARAIRRAA